ncbi:Mpv17 / PMP22 family domain containing protein [Amanita muscaria]
MASFIRAYNAALLRRPLLVNCTTAMVLFGAGDIIAQQAVEKRGKDHDYARTARLTFYGGSLFGPGISVWYSFLNRLKFASPTKAVIYRVWLDQAVLTPFAVAFFFGAMSVLEGKGHEIAERVENAYVPTLLRNWCVFVPTQVINFSVVPPHLRFVVVSVVGLFWNTYLSVANARINNVEKDDKQV